MTSSQFSAFAPSGIRFTRKKSRAKAIYETLRDQWGSLFSDDPTAEINVETFAQAKCLAIAVEQIERAGNQANPRLVTELISKLEKDYLLSPLPGATLAQRRAELEAAKAVLAGERRDALYEGIRAIIGDGLLGLVPQELGAIGTGGMFPDVANAATTGPGKFCSLGAKFKAIVCTTRIFPDSQTVSYRHVAGETTALEVGDVLVVEPSRRGRVERVIITAATSSTFTATFTKTHEPNTTATTAAVQYWVSGRRIIYVIVSSAVLADAALTQRIHRHMRKACGHATQLAIVGASSGTTAGPFVIGESLLGQTPISEVTF